MLAQSLEHSKLQYTLSFVIFPTESFPLFQWSTQFLIMYPSCPPAPLPLGALIRAWRAALLPCSVLWGLGHPDSCLVHSTHEPLSPPSDMLEPRYIPSPSNLPFVSDPHPEFTIHCCPRPAGMICFLIWGQNEGKWAHPSAKRFDFKS